MAGFQSIPEEIEKRARDQHFKLPVFNRVAIKLQKTIASNSNMAQVEKLILKDPALASEVLRVANSAMFSGLTKLESIQQALVRLGTEQVLNIVMVTSQKQIFKAKHPVLNKIMLKLWQHASASAGGCQWVAIKSGYKKIKDQAFLIGLLHDLGSLVILKVLDEIFQEDDTFELTESVIIELINTLHTQYGSQVMESWELPPLFCQISRVHHQEHFDPKNILLIITRLVDYACAKAGVGVNNQPKLVLAALPEVRLLGIKDVYLAELEIQLEDFVEAFS
ncbi:HDOD domain-containing protein [Zooshikella marina]|uniref:HDOD domain-containing protein n=1 Tax=Zooshikella ganghwensis TaxID=202772 RepID=UPI001BB02174|nr:HDOD domain-containing protein [Zooshikella ganghwensis]MBU2705127.1 HDOD domain-containing protein [Zooshikella ganghwensis]